MFKTEARSIVARCVHASKDDVVIFAGTGSSGALKVLVHILGVEKLSRNAQMKGSEHLRPVIFIGPYEHHSNLLPWRESGALIVNIEEAEGGTLSLLWEKILIFTRFNLPDIKVA